LERDFLEASFGYAEEAHPFPAPAPAPPDDATPCPACPDPAPDPLLPRPPSPLGSYGGFATPPDKLRRSQVVNSRRLDLLVSPANASAEALVDAVVEKLLLLERRRGTRRRSRRRAVQAQFRRAVGAIAGNLLLAWSSDPPAPTSRTLNRNSFAGEAVGAKAFVSALNGCEALGLMDRRRGRRARDGSVGIASRFWPAPKLLRLAAEHGVDRATAGGDFRRRRPERVGGGKAPKVRDPLRLKALPSGPKAGSPRRLPIDPRDELASALRSQVVALNDFASTVAVEGCPPPRWYRLFFGDFRLCGRLHAPGDGSYQGMPAAERLGRIRIAGEPVVEIDIRSSLLTFMHASIGAPLPEGGPYDLPGVPRAVVKHCVNATLGKGSPVRRWSANAVRALPALEEHPAPAVMAAVQARYPFLAEPWRAAEAFRHIADPRRVLIHRLMGVESDVILETVQALRAEGVLGLPMHDGLIVPASAEAMTCDLLRAAGERVAGVGLRLTVDRPPA